MRKKTKNSCPLVVEQHPDDYDGYPFITLIQYTGEHEVLAVIDNADDKNISAFVLDMCQPEKIDENQVIEVISEWYYSGRKDRYPISIEFSRLGLANVMSSIYRTYSTDFVTRIIGPLPNFEMNEKPKIKRRKRKGIPKGVILRDKRKHTPPFIGS